jgi:HAD superfamily hydrolase (TIGR01490 family)
MTSQRPFAVFDIDGTVIRWQLYHAIGDQLAKAGLVKNNEFSRVRRARMNWKKRNSEDSFKEYEETLVTVFDEALKGISLAEFKQAVGKVFDDYKEQVYTYTRDLIEELRSKDYILFALSGSPDFIVDLFAKFYDFDDYAGTVYTIKEGRFTGKSNVAVGQKAVLLELLIKKHNLNYSGSVGVGDSESDIPVLELCDRPIAFNPTKGLFEYAKQAGWQVVLERKNVIYKLETVNGKYSLVI